MRLLLNFNPMNTSKILQYKPADLRIGKQWYIQYSAYNPRTESLERKKIRLNHIKSKSERRKYANDLVKRLNNNLAAGWNPFVDPERQKEYVKFTDVVERFLLLIEKKFNSKAIREETLRDYKSYMKIFKNYVNKNYGNIYIYEVTRRLTSDFLDFILIDLDRAIITRNNYLQHLSSFAGYCVEKEHIKVRFTDGIKKLQPAPKQRDIIADAHLKIIWKYLKENNIYLYFAAQMLFNTHIRPTELTFLKISNISFENKTIAVFKGETKNKKDDIVTLPDTLAKLMIELKIHSYPSDYYIFSDYLKPGETKITDKHFRDRWVRVRKKLKLPETYKFYSFKDTGITAMIIKTGNPIAVRDQARHSSLTITDKYTRQIHKKANQDIVEFDSEDI